MHRKVFSVILLFICLVISNIIFSHPVKAQYQQDITINVDGSVSPSSAPIIEKDGTYTLTDDLNGRITISKSHIIFNGNQHTIDQYSASPTEKNGFGIVLDQVYNVTVVNTTIANTGNGVWTLECPTAGIWIYYGGLNVIMRNNLVNNYVAIDVFQSNDNTLTRNNFTNNNNPYGDAPAVMLWGSTNNKIYHNNFIDSKNPAGTGKFNSPTTYTTWNTEKEGNYWSNYNGTDTNNDGIGDTPYIIDENNQDNYPLMEPVNIETIPEFSSWTSFLIVGLSIVFVLSITYRQKIMERRKKMINHKFNFVVLFVFCFTFLCFLDFFSVDANPITNIPLPEPAIIIKSDGSIDPSSAPIHRDGDVYTFTDNIVGYSIIVEKDNITLDGGGFTLKGYGSEGNYSLNGRADPTGVLILQHNGVTVRNMKISGFSYGIKITSLYTLACKNNVLENNTMTSNYYGLHTSGSWYTVLRNNHMSNNVCNFYIYDFVKMNNPSSDLFINDIDSTNTVEGKPIIYWVNEQGKTVPSDAGYVVLVKCTNMTVQNLNLTDNGQGIMLIYTTNSSIIGNHITHTDWGIFSYNSSNLVISKNNLEENNVAMYFMRGSNENIISKNSISDNSNGIQIEYGVNNTVVENLIANNLGWNKGLLLAYSHNNLIYNNSFLHNQEENELQVRILTEEDIPSENMWDNGTLGNYWSDYTTRYPNATEITESGTGNTPYIINENNQDNHPLMKPTAIPEFPSLIVLPLFLIATLTIAFYRKKVRRQLLE